MYVDKESENLKWRNITGPEKVKMFKNIKYLIHFRIYQITKTVGGLISYLQDPVVTKKYEQR